LLKDDDGFILYESWAIARYICEKYRDQGTNLIPFDDLKKRALFEQAASIEQANFGPHVRIIVWEGFVKEYCTRVLPGSVPSY
jgi:glutathione S-transferase